MKGRDFVLIGKSDIHKNKGISSGNENRGGEKKITGEASEPQDKTILGQTLADDGDPSKKLFDLRRKLVDPEGKVPDEVRMGVSRGTLEKGDQTVEIGTYNIEWLGEKKRSEKEVEMLAKVIADSGAEVMGIQEITSEKALQGMLKHLPDFDYVLGTTGVRSDGKKQHVGIIYNKKRVEVIPGSIRELTEAQVPQLMGDNHLRAPLVVDMKADNFDFTMVVLHLKARMDDETKKIRGEQAKVVNNWVKEQIANNPDKDIIVVGDCNDFLNSKSTKALGEGVLHMTTAEAAARGEYSNIPHHSLIDQIGVTTAEGGAEEEYITGSTHVMDTKEYKGYRKWGSDHNPVISSFKSDKDND